jgi:hypothetical protein
VSQVLIAVLVVGSKDIALHTLGPRPEPLGEHAFLLEQKEPPGELDQAASHPGVADAACPPFGEDIGLDRQRLQRRTIDLFEQLPARHAEPAGMAKPAPITTPNMVRNPA